MEKDLPLGDTCGDGRARMQLVEADKIVQPSICYKHCNYLEFQEQHNKGWENWDGKTGVEELLFPNPGGSGCI